MVRRNNAGMHDVGLSGTSVGVGVGVSRGVTAQVPPSRPIAMSWQVPRKRRGPARTAERAVSARPSVRAVEGRPTRLAEVPSTATVPPGRSRAGPEGSTAMARPRPPPGQEDDITMGQGAGDHRGHIPDDVRRLRGAHRQRCERDGHRESRDGAERPIGRPGYRCARGEGGRFERARHPQGDHVPGDERPDGQLHRGRVHGRRKRTGRS